MPDTLRQQPAPPPASWLTDNLKVVLAGTITTLLIVIVLLLALLIGAYKIRADKTPVPPLFPHIAIAKFEMRWSNEARGIGSVWYHAPTQQLRNDELYESGTWTTQYGSLYWSANKSYYATMQHGKMQCGPYPNPNPPFRPDFLVTNCEYNGTVLLRGEDAHIWDCHQGSSGLSHNQWWTAASDGRIMREIIFPYAGWPEQVVDFYSWEAVPEIDPQIFTPDPSWNCT